MSQQSRLTVFGAVASVTALFYWFAMKEVFMNNRHEVISIVLQLLEIVIAVFGAIVSKGPWIAFLLCPVVVFATAIGFVSIRYKRLSEYVSFIEYLNRNGKHEFGILPLLRMYIHRDKTINSLVISEVIIRYKLTPSVSCDKSDSGNSVVLADCEILYEFSIENRNLPKSFYFTLLNDSTKYGNDIQYRFGNSGTYVPIHSKPIKLSPYWEGKMTRVAIGLDNAKVTHNGDIKLFVKVSANGFFAFAADDRDTVVCLPMVYGSTVNRMVNIFDASALEVPDFYCSAKRIYCKNGKCGIDEISCTPDEADKHIFISETSPDNKHENAYYFRPGLSEVDPDDKSIA